MNEEEHRFWAKSFKAFMRNEYLWHPFYYIHFKLKKKKIIPIAFAKEYISEGRRKCYVEKIKP
jgi:hypothetical protein